MGQVDEVKAKLATEIAQKSLDQARNEVRLKKKAIDEQKAKEAKERKLIKEKDVERIKMTTFANALMNGEEPIIAYRQSYGETAKELTDTQVRSRVYTLKKNGYVKELFKKQERKNAEIAKSANNITAQKILGTFATLAESDITDYVKIIDGKVYVTDTDDLTPQQCACIKSIKVTGRGIQIELYDKTMALDKMGNYLGLWRDRPEVASNYNLLDVKDREKTAEKYLDILLNEKEKQKEKELAKFEDYLIEERDTKNG